MRYCLDVGLFQALPPPPGLLHDHGGFGTQFLHGIWDSFPPGSACIGMIISGEMCLHIPSLAELVE